MNVKGLLYTAVLAVNSWIAHAHGIDGSIEQLPAWAVLTVGSLLAAMALLVNAEPAIGARTAEATAPQP